MSGSSLPAIIHELRITLKDIGVDGLSTLVGAATSDDSPLFDKLLELLTKLSEAEDLPYGIVEENIGADGDDADEVDPTYYTPVEQKDELEAVELPSEESARFEEVKTSEYAFPELFPTKQVTKKRQLQKSFPNIDEFDGGVHMLASGNFGFTFKSVLRGVHVVLKVSKIRSEESNRADYHEWSVSEKLEPHPNVLQIIGLCPSFGSPLHASVGTTALIAPLQENGGLREFYDRRTPRDDDILDIAFGMIAGIRSLHEQRVVHRDIAVRNFLVDCDGRVLLCDFGLTEFLPKGQDFLRAPPNETLPWRSLAPESFGGTFTTKSDIWIYGIALIELISKRIPWPTFRRYEDLKQALLNKEIELPNLDAFPPVIADIVRDCLHFEAASRPTANDVAERLVQWQFRDVDSKRDENGNTVIHQFASEFDAMNQSKLWKQLVYIDKPVMVNAVNILDETPLMLVNDSLRNNLLEYRPLPVGNEEPSRIAEYFHNVDVFGTLIKLARKEDVETIKLIGACASFNSVFSRNVSERRQSPNGGNPLHIAAEVGNVALFDVFTSLQVMNTWKANNEGRTVLHVASLHGHTKIIENLIRKDLEETSDEKEVAESGRVNTQDKMGKTALHLAVASGDLSAVRALLTYDATNVNLRDVDERSPIFDAVVPSNIDASMQASIFRAFVHLEKVDLNAKDSSNETVLHHIARNDCAQLAHIFFERPDQKVHVRENEQLYAPLHVAVREQSFNVANILLAREEVDVNEADKHGNTVLHILAALPISRRAPPGEDTLANPTPLMTFVKDLVARDDIDLNIRNSRGDTPLLVAVRDKNDNTAKAILSQRDVNINAGDKNRRTPLHWVSQRNAGELAAILLSRSNVDVNARDSGLRTPLHVAITYKSLEVVQMLLSRSDINADARGERQRTPLHEAIRHTSFEVVQMLLSRGDVNADARDDRQRTPLHEAVIRNAAEVAAMLLSRSDVDADARDYCQRTPLHWASIKRWDKVFQMLLSRSDVDADARDEHKRTPLHFASQKNAPKVAAMLLSRSDVDANARGTAQRTPLHLASNENAAEVAAMLLSRSDVDADARDRYQRTPLHLASYENAADVAAMLLSRSDVDANARDKDQRTPLHLASYENAADVAAILLSRGDVEREVGARDSGDRTALHLAVERGSKKCVELLERASSIPTSS